MVLELEGKQTEAPPNLFTKEELIGLARDLQNLDRTKKELDKNGNGLTVGLAKALLEQKDDLIDNKILPARKSRLPENCQIKVGLLEDEKGREWKNLIEISIQVDDEIFKTRTLTPEYRKDDKGEVMKQIIGAYDYKIIRLKDKPIHRSKPPRNSPSLKRR